MSPLKPNQVTDPETADSNWKNLYKVGGAAALITAVVMPIQIIVYIASPPPSTVIGFFTLLQNDSLLGLLALDLLLIVDQVLLVPIILALYTVLGRANESFMAIALTLGIVGIAAYFASNTACFLSVINMRLRQQIHRDLCCWQQGRRCLPSIMALLSS